MNLKKIFSFGFIVCCLLGYTIAMEKANDNSEALKTFKCPTIEEIHTRAATLRELATKNPYALTFFTFTTKEGIIFKAQFDPWNQNRNVVQRALNLTKYTDICCIEKDGYLKKILFRYFPDNGQDLILKVDLKEMRIDPTNIFYPIDHPERISTSADGTKYIIFKDSNLIFKIQQ